MNKIDDNISQAIEIIKNKELDETDKEFIIKLIVANENIISSQNDLIEILKEEIEELKSR